VTREASALCSGSLNRPANSQIPQNPVTGITRVIVGWKDIQNGGAAFVDTRLTRTDDIPGNREFNKEDDD
jgi:hypothetical protein